MCPTGLEHPQGLEIGELHVKNRKKNIKSESLDPKLQIKNLKLKYI